MSYKNELDRLNNFLCKYKFSTRYFLLQFVLLLYSITSLANADSILNFAKGDRRLKAFRDWAYYNIYWEHKGTRQYRPVTYAVLEKIYKAATEQKDEKLKREAWFSMELWKIGGAVAAFKPKDSTVVGMLNSAEVAHKWGWSYTEAECYMAASTVYFSNGNFEQAFNQSHKGLRIIEDLGLKKYPEANMHLAEIANQYYSFFQYDSVVSLTLRALQVDDEWKEMPKHYSIVTTLALAYEELGKTDSAILWFNESIKFAKKANETFWYPLTMVNLAKLYYSIEEDSLAFQLSRKSFEESNRVGFFNVAGRAAVILAGLYARMGNLDSAHKYENYFRKYVPMENDYGKIILYKILGSIYERQKDYEKAIMFLDSADFFLNKDKRVHNSILVNRSKQLADMDGYSARIKLAQSTQETERVNRNLIFTLVVLICISAGMFINRMRVHKNIQVKTALWEKKMAEEELKQAKIELEGFTKIIQEKNELVNQFKTAIQEIKMEDKKDFDETAVLSELNETTILTEEDWRRFKELFDKVYPGFLIRLKEKFPALSAADTRLITLTKLKINPKDMASMLGVGYEAIRKARQRTRIKMKLEKAESFEQVIESV